VVFSANHKHHTYRNESSVTAFPIALKDLWTWLCSFHRLPFSSSQKVKKMVKVRMDRNRHEMSMSLV
jgi:hypothetical protein